MWLQQTFESAILLEQHLGNYPKGVIKHGHPRTQWGIGNFFLPLIEGSLEVKLPTIWTDEKQRWEESEKRREEKNKEDQRRERVRRKKIQVRKKVEKSRNTVFSNGLWLRRVEK